MRNEVSYDIKPTNGKSNKKGTNSQDEHIRRLEGKLRAIRGIVVELLHHPTTMDAYRKGLNFIILETEIQGANHDDKSA